MSIATRQSARPVDPIKLWTTSEFDRLVSLGLVEEGSDTYLWEGQIVEPMPEYQPHRNAVWNLVGLLNAILGTADWTIDGNAPLPLEDGFKPQPDFIVARGPRSKYRVGPPLPSDVAMVIEVSDSTYHRDMGERLRKYAQVRIPLYWIINIPERRVEVYEDPLDGSGYQRRTDYGLDQNVPLRLLSERGDVVREISVIDILRDSLEPSQNEGHA